MAEGQNGAASIARQERFPVEVLRERVSYDPDAGTFTRIAPDGSRPVGSRIDRIQPSSGYRVLYALGAYHLGQRVAWALMTGEWPSGLIDFVNGDRSDCRWSNLRLANKGRVRLDRDGLMQAVMYDPETGSFTWKHRANQPANWNTRWAGKPAGSLDKDGYLCITISGYWYKGHRLAVLFMTGEWPPEDVDHADLNPSNNSWSNLRLATRTQNNGNLPLRQDGSSGLKGAHWDRRAKRWTSTIQHKGVSRYLGTFPSREAAHAAYVRAAEDLFGEFARAR